MKFYISYLFFISFLNSKISNFSQEFKQKKTFNVKCLPLFSKNRSKSVNQAINIFRILRVIRPLRSINKLPKLKVCIFSMNSFVYT